MSVPIAYLTVIAIWSTTPLAIKWSALGTGFAFAVLARMAIAPGYRVGWILPGRWRKAVEHLKYVGTMANATLPQLAMADYLADSRYERHLVRVRRAYADHLARVQSAINRYFPAGTRASRPKGGSMLWMELPEGRDTMALYEKALAAGISFTPGRLFSPQAKYGNCLRLAAALPWDARVEGALAELGRLAGKA